jgi:hypothetical protein
MELQLRLHLYKIIILPNIIGKMRWVGHVTCMGQIGNTYKILVGKYEGKSSLGKPRHRLEDNIGMDLREMW